MNYFPNMINTGINDINNIFNKLNEFEMRIRKIEQYIGKQEGDKKYKPNNYSESNNSLYMI